MFELNSAFLSRTPPSPRLLRAFRRLVQPFGGQPPGRFDLFNLLHEFLLFPAPHKQDHQEDPCRNPIVSAMTMPPTSPTLP